MTASTVLERSAGAATPGARLLFVEAARAVAVLLMIQGHTLSVFLAPEYQASEIAQAWFFVRGLTSCTFFFLAGFSFVVATTRKWEDYRVPTWNLFRRLARYLALLVFGYAMHLPGGSFAELSQAGREQWLAFVTVDVLQLIAVSLLFLQAVTWLVRSRRELGLVATVAAVLVVLVTPVSWDAGSASSIPLAVAAYLSGTAGSLFPLFPWSAYVFFGAAAGSWHQEKVEKGSVTFSGARVLAVGIGMIAAAALMHAVPFSPYGAIEFWAVSPNLFLVKGGAMLIGLSAAVRITAGRTRLPGVVTALSRQSLVIYVVHLMVLYHPDFGAAAVQRAALRLGPVETVAAALGLMAAMSLLAWLIHERRRYLAEMIGWAHAHAHAAAASFPRHGARISSPAPQSQ